MMRRPVVVGLCTFRRPAMLAEALDSLTHALAAEAGAVGVVVVDNDGADPAVRSVVERFAARVRVPVRFVVEPTPGISAAREQVFRAAGTMGADLLAMFDDDERVSPGWLSALCDEQARSGAVVVAGPVLAVFPGHAKHLERHARFWSVGLSLVKGRPYIQAAGNFLIDLQAIAGEPRPLFDAAFGLSGGEDVLFFRRLHARGHATAWAAQAVVHETVPDARASKAWMRRRRFSVGNTDVRVETALGSRQARALFKSAALSFRLLFYPALRREPESPWFGWDLELRKILGRYAAHLGRVDRPYQRARETGPPMHGRRDPT